MCKIYSFAPGTPGASPVHHHLDEIEPLFAATAGLSRLSRADIALLCQHMSLHAAGRNTVLLDSDDPDARMLLLLTGRARVVMADPPAHWPMLPGMALGELAMLDGLPLQAACVSTEPVDYLVMTRVSFAHLALVHPALSTQWLAALMHGLFRRQMCHETSLVSGMSGAMSAP